jgi:hypothetical protein
VASKQNAQYVRKDFRAQTQYLLQLNHVQLVPTHLAVKLTAQNARQGFLARRMDLSSRPVKGGSIL